MPSPSFNNKRDVKTRFNKCYKLSCFNTVRAASSIVNRFCCVEGRCACYPGLSACSCTVCNIIMECL
jgi:hypothetical protein